MKLAEKGFILIEVLVATAIIALIASAAAMATLQVIKGTEQSNDQMTAISQVQNAGYWISYDTRMAETVTADNLTPPNFLSLSWTEEESGDEHQVIYILEAMPDSGLKKLERRETINEVLVSITGVAQYIVSDPVKTKCEFENGTLTLTVTATINPDSPSRAETRVYQAAPRVS